MNGLGEATFAFGCRPLGLSLPMMCECRLCVPSLDAKLFCYAMPSWSDELMTTSSLPRCLLWGALVMNETMRSESLFYFQQWKQSEPGE